MFTVWQKVEVREIYEITELPGVCVEALPVLMNVHSSLHKLFRSEDMPSSFRPLMVCSLWSYAGVVCALYKRVRKDDCFTFDGPSNFAPTIKRETDFENHGEHFLLPIPELKAVTPAF
jgi:hypothetical protein